VKIQIDKLKGKCLEIRSLFVLLLIVSAGLCFSGRNAGAQDPSKTPPQAQGQRTNRSQAYLKLLEGQRYYSGISEGDADTKLKAAEAAFKEAIALNPDLIEAHAALAEVSFYLQNFDQTISEAQAAIKLSPDNLGAHKVLSRVYSIKSGLREANPDPKAVELAVAELKRLSGSTRIIPKGGLCSAIFITNRARQTKRLMHISTGRRRRQAAISTSFKSLHRGVICRRMRRLLVWRTH